MLELEQVFRCIAPGSMFSAALVAPGNLSNQQERETNRGPTFSLFCSISERSTEGGAGAAEAAPGA